MAGFLEEDSRQGDPWYLLAHGRDRRERGQTPSRPHFQFVRIGRRRERLGFHHRRDRRRRVACPADGGIERRGGGGRRGRSVAVCDTVRISPCRDQMAEPVVDLDPRAPDFVRDPYPSYGRLRDVGRVFQWNDLGHRCCARYDDVNALLRDRRFGRQILHVATREELAWPEPAAHLAPFHEFERHSLLELEPPRHTRLRGFVASAFLPRDMVPHRVVEVRP